MSTRRAASDVYADDGADVLVFEYMGENVGVTAFKPAEPGRVQFDDPLRPGELFGDPSGDAGIAFADGSVLIGTDVSLLGLDLAADPAGPIAAEYFTAATWTYRH